MNKSPNPILIDIKKIIARENLDTGRAMLTKFLKSNALTAWDTIYVSIIYRSLSEFDRALKILGPELGPLELQIVSDDHLAVQMRLAYMLQHIGARFLGERLFFNLATEAQRRGKDPSSINPSYLRYLRTLYLTLEDFPKVLVAARKTSLDAFQQTSSDDSNLVWWSAKIDEATALHELHDYQNCEQLLGELLKDSISQGGVNRASIHLGFALLYLDLEKGEVALHQAEEAEKHLKNTASQLYIYIHRTFGLYYSLRGDATLAVSYLKRCIESKIWPLTPPYTKMMVYYWLEYNLGAKVPLEQRLAARAHVTFCPVSYALGKRYTHDRLPLSLHFKMKYIPNDHDCWVIDGNNILATSYDKTIRQYLSEKWTLFDLYSGIVLIPHSAPPLPIFLTTLQVMCVSSILGAGDIGISKWALIDFIYRQNFYHPSDGENRLKTLVKNLRKLGFEIKCDVNIYSMELPKNRIIILPMNHLTRGPQSILVIKCPVFKRIDVEKIFQIGPSMAKNWIKQWLEEGIVESAGRGRKIIYHFKKQK